MERDIRILLIVSVALTASFLFCVVNSSPLMEDISSDIEHNVKHKQCHGSAEAGSATAAFGSCGWHCLFGRAPPKIKYQCVNGSCVCLDDSVLKITIIPPTPPTCEELVTPGMPDPDQSCLFSCLMSGKPGATCSEPEGFCLCLEVKSTTLMRLLPGPKCSELLPSANVEAQSRACSFACFEDKHIGGFCTSDHCMCMIRKVTSPTKIVDNSIPIPPKLKFTIGSESCSELSLPPLGLEPMNEKRDCSRFCVWKDYVGGVCGRDNKCYCIQKGEEEEVVNETEPTMILDVNQQSLDSVNDGGENTTPDSLFSM